ncbi:hypothetical protein ACHAXN_005622 [Cyclotella atomus]
MNNDIIRSGSSPGPRNTTPQSASIKHDAKIPPQPTASVAKKRKINPNESSSISSSISEEGAIQLLLKKLESDGASHKMKLLARKILANERSPGESMTPASVRNAVAATANSRFHLDGDVDNASWIDCADGEEKKQHRNTALNDSRMLRAVLYATSKGNPKRAADAIQGFVRSDRNKSVSDKLAFCQDSSSGDNNNSKKASGYIVDSIKSCVEHHTNGAGRRTDIAETFIRNVADACIFGQVKNNEKKLVSDDTISKLTGLSKNVISQSHTRVDEMLRTNSTVPKFSRKERKSKIVNKAWKYILDFINDDLYTRVDDTKQELLISITDPRTTDASIQLHRRIWRVANSKKRQHALFLESGHYRAFQQENEGRTVGLTLFRKILKEFKKVVRDPGPGSCVDEEVSVSWME